MMRTKKILIIFWLLLKLSRLSIDLKIRSCRGDQNEETILHELWCSNKRNDTKQMFLWSWIWFSRYKEHKKIITSIIFFVILMSPLFFLIHFGRQYLQASIILYALALILCVFWYRIVQTILIRLGLVTMTNIEIK